jgi:hypothetical protein
MNEQVIEKKIVGGTGFELLQYGWMELSRQQRRRKQAQAKSKFL